jgi:hypothetical protein
LLCRRPEQFDLPAGLWERSGVRQLIEARFGVYLSAASLARLLKKMGFFAPRPLKRGSADPGHYRRLQETYDAVRRRARRQRASIWFLHAAGMMLNCDENFPVQVPLDIAANPAGLQSNDCEALLMGAINAKGTFNFACYPPQSAADALCDFLKALVNGASRPVYLIAPAADTFAAAPVKRLERQLAKELRLVCWREA